MKTATFIIVSLSMLFFSAKAFNNYLAAKQQEKAAELRSQEFLALIHARNHQVGQETKRVELMVDLLDSRKKFPPKSSMPQIPENRYQTIFEN